MSDQAIARAQAVNRNTAVLCVNKCLRGELREAPGVTVSYDEKPGVQALAAKSPDLPPVPGQYPSHTRDYECQRLGTVSLLAGLDPAQRASDRNGLRHPQKQ